MLSQKQLMNKRKKKSAKRATVRKRKSELMTRYGVLLGSKVYSWERAVAQLPRKLQSKEKKPKLLKDLVAAYEKNKQV